MNENQLLNIVYKSGLAIHKELGPGLLESAYEECLEYELINSGLYVRRQVGLPLIYKEINLNIGYRVDLIVENKVLVEIKSIEKLNYVHTAQMVTYLKLSGLKLGLLINFNVPFFRDGARRIINGQLDNE